MARRHPCDVCGYERRRWQRLCGFCWSRLPGNLRSAIVDAWRRKAKAEWRAAVRTALDYMGDRVVAHVRAVSATQAYERTAAQLGERDA